MTGSVAMVEVLRGPFVESVHRGHGVVCTASGDVVHAWGEPDMVMLPRSSCKMLQALPLLESGAAEDLSPERLALACASHEGGAMHVDGVRDWLGDLGCQEDDLLCGPQTPGDRTERHRLRGAGEAPGQVHNNCSGKHTGFLMLRRHLGAGADYVDPDNPVQKAVRAAFEEMTGAGSPGFGIDGCSAPNFATTMRGLARAMARMADPRGLGAARGRAAERLVTAMRAHPMLVAGEGRACSELMLAMDGPTIAKTGAEGVFTAILPEKGFGVAVKIEDGTTRGAECAIAAILARLGVADPAHPFVGKRLTPPILSRRGLPAGSIRPTEAFWEGGRAL